MGQRLPQLVPILSLGCSLYSESETIYWLEFGLTLHRHIEEKKKKKGQTLNPSGAPELNKTFKQLVPDSSSSSSSVPHLQSHPLTLATHSLVQESGRRQGPKSEADVWDDERGWGGDNRKDMDPARTACCSDLLPRLRKIE